MIRPASPRAGALFAVLLVAAASGLIAPAQAEQDALVPSPEQFFGFPMGSPRQLARWDRMVDYFELVAERSDRVRVRELGKTTLGLPYVLAVVSTPDTVADLPRYQAMQRQLADPRRTSRAVADTIARDGKAVLLIGANVHATEIGTNQMMNDLIYQLATDRSPWMEHVLDNTIVLLIPSQNPDGQRLVVDWYRRNLDTPYEGSPLPELYHPYAGHDNNRDSYMLTQVETQHLNRVMYHDWLPEVYLDKHQMGNSYARIFVPPFKNPPNPNIDPLLWSEVNLLGQAIAAKLLRLLQAEAAEVSVADAPFVADGRAYPAGTYVLPLSQPFGRWIKDILEAQEYPDIRWPSPSAPLDKPYDVTAWSLGMLMGVDTIRIDRPFDARLTRLRDPVEAPAGRVVGDARADTYLLGHESNQSVVAMNRLLAAGANIQWARQAFDLAAADGAATRRIEPGAIVVSGVRDASPDVFFGPGSIVRIAVETTHPIGYGMPAEADAMFVNNGGYVPPRGREPARATTVVRYPDGPLLRSGWMIGEERLRGTAAVIEAPTGRGRVILHTFRVQHRGQTWGTFKLLFNSIFYGPAISGRPSVQTSLDAH